MRPGRTPPPLPPPFAAQLNPTTVYQAKGSVKHRGSDFLAIGGLSVGQQGKTADVSYHQYVTPNITAGGALAADLDALMPPHIAGLTPTVYATWKRDKDTWLAKLALGSSIAMLKYHREVAKGLEMGTTLNYNVGSGESTLGGGFRMQLGQHTSSPTGGSTTLVAAATTDMKVSMSYTMTGMMGVLTSDTPVQTVTMLSATLDHRHREHQIGMQLQFHY